MEGRKVIGLLEAQSPASYALDWDNVGLLAGDPDKEIHGIHIALDATDEAVAEAVRLGADLLLTHHPLIFKGIRRVVADDFIGRRLIALISHDIAYYAMHTNFDVKGMAELSAQMLGLSDTRVLDVTAAADGSEEGIGRTGVLAEPMSLAACADLVKSVFSAESVKVFGDRERIVTRAAISPGSGKSEIGNAIASGADVLITGDIDHHDGIDAVARGLCIIDAGHYGLEHIFVPYMKDYLSARCEGVRITVQQPASPFWIV